MELSATAYVILGMLGWRPMSGYEIKSLVDGSTRFFWAASYGQIYPELRRLAAAGLIEGKAEPRGGRKRNMYRLTPAGRRELRAWLASAPEIFEMRDEALLKLFFAGSGDGGSASETLEAKRRKHEEIVTRLRQIESTGKPQGYAHLVLSYGVELNEWVAEWCERTAAALEKESVAQRRSA
jgi:DNA-binding PadR family transcriptional regulator